MKGIEQRSSASRRWSIPIADRRNIRYLFTIMKLSSVTRLGLLLIALLLPLSCLTVTGRGTIAQDRLRSHVEYLASDRLAGRAVGSTGIAEAEDYIADRFREQGLVPLPGQSGYFLDFTLYEYGFDKRELSLSTQVGDRLRRGSPGFDFAPLPCSSPASADGDLVFAGYGISDPGSGYDDYEGLDVRGKIVLAFHLEPDRFITRGPSGRPIFSKRAEAQDKIAAAAARGARAVLFFSGPRFFATGWDPFKIPQLYSLAPDTAYESILPDDKWYRPASLPAFLVSSEWGGSLLSAAGLSAGSLEKALNRGERPAAFRLKDASARLVCRRLSPPRAYPARDVAAFLPGSEASMADEWIVVGAHHDHLGAQEGLGDVVFNGADDNASGAAGLLELARTLPARRPPLRRGVAFIAFSAEELGLIGSEALFVRSFLPPGRVKAMVNLDMIGRNPGQDLGMIAGDETSGLSRAAAAFLASRPVRTAIQWKEKPDTGSDHQSFKRRGIPSFFFFDGDHPDYHGPDDEADRLDYPTLTERVRLVFDFIGFLDGWTSAAQK